MPNLKLLGILAMACPHCGLITRTIAAYNDDKKTIHIVSSCQLCDIAYDGELIPENIAKVAPPGRARQDISAGSTP